VQACERILGLQVARVESDGTIETSHHAAEKALEHEPTAIVCFNDLSAIGVISRLRDEGLNVPHDISVAGFDDLVIGRHFFPALTTASSPRDELGRHGWALLQDAINGRAPEKTAVMLAATLHKRQSTGPARAA